MALTSLHIIELIWSVLSFVWKDGWNFFVFLFSDGAEAGYCCNDVKKHYVTVLKIFMFYLIQLDLLPFRENLLMSKMWKGQHYFLTVVPSKEKYAWWMGVLYSLCFCVICLAIINVCFFSVTWKEFFLKNKDKYLFRGKKRGLFALGNSWLEDTCNNLQNSWNLKRTIQCC